MADYKIGIRITGQLESSFHNAINGAKNGVSALGMLGKASMGVVKASAGALGAAMTGLGAFGVYAIKNGMEIEQAISNAGATARATSSELEVIKNKSLELGASTSFTAAEVASGFEQMALGGWEVSRSAESMGDILNFANATGMDLATTTQLVATNTAVLDITTQKATQSYFDMLSAMQTAAPTTAQAMMEAFNSVGSVLGTLGVSETDASRAFAIFAQSHVEGAEAGTALKSVLMKMTAPTSAAAKALKSMGIECFDATGAFRGIGPVFTEVAQSMAGLTEEQKIQKARDIWGLTQADSALDLLKGFTPALGEAESAWEKYGKTVAESGGAAAEQAAQRINNLAGDLTLLESAAQGFAGNVYLSDMQTPVREWAQFGTECLNQLNEAFLSGGFEGVLSKVGELVPQIIARVMEDFPQLISLGKDLVLQILDGLDQNSAELGRNAGLIIDELATAIIEIAPRLVVVGAKLIVEIANGIIANIDKVLPAIKEAGGILMKGLGEALGAAGKGFVENIGTILKGALHLTWILPAVAGGFLAFKKIQQTDGPLKKFIQKLTGIGNAGKQVKNGVLGAGNVMSAFAKNILGIGGGIALIAGSLWILADAAIRLADAGPGAAVAMGLMVGAIGGLIVVAAQAAPKMRSAGKGFLMFGAAVAMCAGGMWIMADAAARVGQVGPQANIALGIMAGGLAGLMFVAGTVGPALKRSVAGLLAFGGAVIMCAGGMWIMADAAARIGEVGPQANIALGIMVGGLAGLMLIAGTLGSALNKAAFGLLAFGAAILIASLGMSAMVDAAIALDAAGAGAEIALGIMLGGLLGVGAAAGAMAPLLIEGAVALAALGAALWVVGWGFDSIMGPAERAFSIFQQFCELLPQLEEHGKQAGEAISEIAAGLFELAAAAAAVGGCGLAGGLGLFAFAAGAWTAKGQIEPVAESMKKLGEAVQMLKGNSDAGVDGIRALGDAAKSAKEGLTGLDSVIMPVGPALESVVSPAQNASDAMTPLAVAVTQFAGNLNVAYSAAVLLASALRMVADAEKEVTPSAERIRSALELITSSAPAAADGMMQLAGPATEVATAVTAMAGPFQTVAPLFALCADGAVMLSGVLDTVTTSFGTLAGSVPEVGSALGSLSGVLPGVVEAMISLSPAAAIVADAFTSIGSSASATLAAMEAVASYAVAAAAAFEALASAMPAAAAAFSSVAEVALAAMSDMAAAVQAGADESVRAITDMLSKIISAVRSEMGKLPGIARTAMMGFTGAIRSEGSNAVSAAKTVVSNVKSAFQNVNLSDAGANMMKGLTSGIKSMKQAVVNAASDVARAASSAINKALDMHSPSRVTMQSGRYVSEGLAIGMRQEQPTVERAAQEVAAPVQSMGRSAHPSEWSLEPLVLRVIDQRQIVQPVDMSPRYVTETVAVNAPAVNVSPVAAISDGLLSAIMKGAVQGSAAQSAPSVIERSETLHIIEGASERIITEKAAPSPAVNVSPAVVLSGQLLDVAEMSHALTSAVESLVIAPAEQPSVPWRMLFTDLQNAVTQAGEPQKSMLRAMQRSDDDGDRQSTGIQKALQPQTIMIERIRERQVEQPAPVINYSPTINVTGGGESVAQEVKEVLAQDRRKFEREMRRFTHNEGRVRFR